MSEQTMLGETKQAEESAKPDSASVVHELPEIYGPSTASAHSPLQREEGQNVSANANAKATVVESGRALEADRLPALSIDHNYKPTDKELAAALNSINPEIAMAKIADRLAVVSLADLANGGGDAENSTRGLNNPEFKKALEQYINEAGPDTYSRTERIRQLAGAIGRDKGYFIQERIAQANGQLSVEFSKLDSPVIENGRQMRSGKPIAADLKLFDARHTQGTELAAKCSKAAEITGPGKGLNDPGLRREIEEFVSKNYLEGKFADFFLQQQFIDKIKGDCTAKLQMNNKMAKLTFSRMKEDGTSTEIADITVHPFLSQARMATKLGEEFNNAKNDQEIDTAISHLQLEFQTQMQEAKGADEAKHRFGALLDRISGVYHNGRLELPPDLELPKDFKNKKVEVEVTHVPIRRRRSN